MTAWLNEEFVWSSNSISSQSLRNEPQNHSQSSLCCSAILGSVLAQHQICATHNIRNTTYNFSSFLFFSSTINTFRFWSPRKKRLLRFSLLLRWLIVLAPVSSSKMFTSFNAFSYPGTQIKACSGVLPPRILSIHLISSKQFYRGGIELPVAQLEK